MSTLVALTALVLPAQRAQAGYVVTLTQQSPNVVATGSGPIDLTGLRLAIPDDFGFGSGLCPNSCFFGTGATIGIATGAGSSSDAYAFDSAIIIGPQSFGSGITIGGFTGSGNGDAVGLFYSPDPSVTFLLVPPGYVSDSPLSDSATYTNQTFTGLGVTPGTYVWSWGTGPDQNFTLVISGAAVVPEPASLTVLAMGLAGLGMALRKQPA